MKRTVLAAVFAGTVIVAAVPGALRVEAQKGVALAGAVSSSQEGKMEGVLVTARRDGANFAVTVVSNDKGVYSFPSTHLIPGTYSLRIWAIGYDLTTANPSVDVPAGKSAALDLTLDKTKDLSSQISTKEWLMSIPGTDEEKAFIAKPLVTCMYCHSLERTIKSRHNAEQFIPVIDRMESYYPDGTMAGTEGRGRAVLDKDAVERAKKNPRWGYGPWVQKTDIAAYLAKVNQHGGRPLPELKTLPRPKGKETRVIITEYDLPRRDTVAHDFDLNEKGWPWYNDQSGFYLGTMNPETGEFKEYPVPRPEHHTIGGVSDLSHDREGNIWTVVTSDKSPDSHWGYPGRLDPRTGEFTFVEMPKGARSSQFINLGRDGSIWNGPYKIDTKAMKVVDTVSYQDPNAPPGPHGVYDNAVDSKGNWWGLDFSSSYIIRVDAKTKAVKWFKTPTVLATPRRGTMDDQDRFWFGEFAGDNVGMFDTKTEKFVEYPLGQWTNPYTSSAPDAKGRVYSPSSFTARVFRVDPKTREVVGYLMPRKDFDAKELVIDPISKTTVWMSNKRNARLIKLEPLD